MLVNLTASMIDEEEIAFSEEDVEDRLLFDLIDDEFNSEDVLELSEIKICLIKRIKQLLTDLYKPTIMHDIATVLNPKTKNKLQRRNERRYSAAIGIITTTLDNMPTVESRLNNKRKYNELDEDSQDEDKESELEEYKNFKTSNMEPEQFWVKNLDRWPKLARYALFVLGIPASSSAIERQFSVAGYYKNSRRSSLLPESLNNRMLVQMAVKENII